MKFSTLAVAMVAMVSLAVAPACRKAEERSAEKIAEKIIEAQSGGKTDVDLSGKSVKVTTTEGGKEITYQAAGAGQIALPAEFPKDLPVYPKSRLLSTASQGSEGMTAIFQTADPTAQVFAALKKEIAASGWVTAMETITPEFTMLSVTKGKRGANLAVTGTPGQETTISLTYQAAAN